jgi:hypothetical protein
LTADSCTSSTSALTCLANYYLTSYYSCFMCPTGQTSPAGSTSSLQCKSVVNIVQFSSTISSISLALIASPVTLAAALVIQLNTFGSGTTFTIVSIKNSAGTVIYPISRQLTVALNDIAPRFKRLLRSRHYVLIHLQRRLHARGLYGVFIRVHWRLLCWQFVLVHLQWRVLSCRLFMCVRGDYDINYYYYRRIVDDGHLLNRHYVRSRSPNVSAWCHRTWRDSVCTLCPL